MLIGIGMGWGEWMVADITTEQQFQLEQSIRVVQQNVKNHPDRLAAVMADLLRQNTLQASILRSATKRICELEIQLELGVKPGHRFTMHPLRRLWRRVRQVVMIGRG
jgi:hypothetical protein